MNMSHIAVNLAIGLRLTLLVLLVLGRDVDHGKYGRDDITLLHHFLLGFVEEGVGVFDVLAEPFDLIMPVIDVGERVQLGLVVVEDVLEGQLLLLKLGNALLVDLAFFLVVKLH